MVTRLPEEQQKEVDSAWDNMLRPPDRLDRVLLLDTILSSQLWQLGIDRLDLTSEKRYADGWIRMEVRFDREHPELDEFALTLLDKTGRQLRRERYTREEVDERFAFLAGGCDVMEGETPEEASRRTAFERRKRKEEIAAATQPADSEP
jgi:hypothetical protein